MKIVADLHSNYVIECHYRYKPGAGFVVSIEARGQSPRAEPLSHAKDTRKQVSILFRL